MDAFPTPQASEEMAIERQKREQPALTMKYFNVKMRLYFGKICIFPIFHQGMCTMSLTLYGNRKYGLFEYNTAESISVQQRFPKQSF